MSMSFPVRLVVRAAQGAALFVLAAAAPSLPAKPVKPPVDLLYASPNVLVAGTLIEINPTGRLVFERGEVLNGEPPPPQRIDVRVAAPLLADVKIGERYIFAYASVHTDRNTVERDLAANRAGAIVLSSTGIEPALFHDTPDVRALLQLGRTGQGRASDAFVESLLRALEGEDAQLRLLAAGQIALDADVRDRLRRSGRTVTGKVARDATVAPTVRTLLLQSAAQWPRQLGDWWRPAALDVVTTTPTGGYAREASDPTGLVLVALELLNQHDVKVPAKALKRWLRSSAPLLAEHAILMLRRESPAVERPAIREALADPQLPAQTRLFLNDHLRRLDRQAASAKARKDGTE
jgi:hypothetical protein